MTKTNICTATSLPVGSTGSNTSTDVISSMSVTNRLLTTEQAAAVLGFTERFLESRRTRGNGPRYVRISARAVRYRLQDLNDWAESRLTTSTSA
jgi:predicted DNA-binding transcriptional regulator AlpA